MGEASVYTRYTLLLSPCARRVYLYSQHVFQPPPSTPLSSNLNLSAVYI